MQRSYSYTLMRVDVLQEVLVLRVKMARTRMALSFVIVDKKLASTNPFDLFPLSFLFKDSALA